MIHKQIESPFSKGVAVLERKPNVLSFRKNDFEITEHFYVCEDTKEEFTTSELDAININQVYNSYRDKFGLPFPDQIKRIRQKYGVSAAKMSEILGLGANSYRLYEQGEVPSVGNGRLILAAEDPKEFKRFLIASEELIEPKDFKKIKNRIDELFFLEDQKSEQYYNLTIVELFNKIVPDEYTGYRLPNFEKIANIVLFFSERTQTWITKLNKLLFYCDFLSFKNYGYSVTGIDYRAIKLGPVPSKFQKMYELLSEGELVDREYMEFENGNYGSYFKPCLTFNETLFEEHEIEIMNFVINKFKYTRPKEIIEISHSELAWKNNIEEQKIISYKDYAFNLEAI